MSKLAIGSAQFGIDYGVSNKLGKVTLEHTKEILELASSNNITTIDTAVAYGDSEEILGICDVKEFDVITKLPSIPDDCLDVSAWVDQVITKSFEKLKVKSLYGLLLHAPKQLKEDKGQEIYLSLKYAQEKYNIKKIGVSVYDPIEIEDYFSRYHFDIVQAPLNVFDRRLIISEQLSHLHDSGVEVHVRSVFLQGLLLMSPNELPEKFKSWKASIMDWNQWVENNHLSSIEACLGFVLGYEKIAKVVVGITSVKELQEIINASNNKRFQVPDRFQSKDSNLINPANWNLL